MSSGWCKLRPASARRIHATQRSASSYLAVLGTLTLVLMIGLSALAAVRIQRELTGRSEEFSQARVLGRSGIEWALAKMGRGQAWRNQLSAGNWLAYQPFGGGTISVTAVDPVDGSIANNTTDPLLLTGLGTYARAQYSVQVKLVPVPGPLAALATCLHAQGNIAVNQPITLNGGALSTNGQVARNAPIRGNLEAASQTGLATVSGQITVPAPAKLMPQTSLVDTWISKAQSVGMVTSIDRQAWGPGCTPGGFTNLDGIYYINTTNNDLTIRRSRIHGTLIVRCSGRKVEFDDEVFMDAHRQGYPTLIVDGNVVFNGSNSMQLSESSNDTNFNPPGADYNGVWNFDTADNYPNELRGLVYVTGTITINGNLKLTGTVICNSSVNTSNSGTTITYDPTFYSSPPVGFQDPAADMAIQNGSWQRVVLP